MNIFKGKPIGTKFKCKNGENVYLSCCRCVYNFMWEIKCIVAVEDKYGFDSVELKYYQDGRCKPYCNAKDDGYDIVITESNAIQEYE